jgi:hypothetical protein
VVYSKDRQQRQISQGIERLLRKNGMSRAEAESFMQITRAARSQAQAMIGGG